jgi:hypothetical protein
MMVLEVVRQHYLHLWGEPSRIIPLHSKDYHIDVYKWDASANPEEVTLYATLGASVFPQPGHATSHRFEFYTGLLPELDAIATVLAEVAIYSVKEQAPIGPGHSITWLEPLWPGTQMRSVLLKRSAIDLIPMVDSLEDGLHVEFLAIRLLYPSELQFKQQHSLEALTEHWRRHNVRFWDPNRPPEPA